MDLKELINHPERMDRDTLFELRSLLALYPYFQTARLLMLQNLYLLHDTSFDEELRRAAIYITDRKVLFNMIEAAHYQLRQQTSQATTTSETSANPNRTVDLIDSFLDTIPPEEEEDEKQGKRAPTPADATIDYVAYFHRGRTCRRARGQRRRILHRDTGPHLYQAGAIPEGLRHHRSTQQ